MATPTYEPIANITLSSSASSVTFSSLPQGFRDLVLVVDMERSGTGISNYTIQLRMNGDSGSNYSDVAAGATTSVFSNSTASGTSIRQLYLGNNTGKALIITSVQDYSATDKHKTVLTRDNSNRPAVTMYAGRYASTTAVTSLEISTNGDSIASGATLSLYGIEA